MSGDRMQCSRYRATTLFYFFQERAQTELMTWHFPRWRHQTAPEQRPRTNQVLGTGVTRFTPIPTSTCRRRCSTRPRRRPWRTVNTSTHQSSLGGHERRILVGGRRISVDRVQLLHKHAITLNAGKSSTSDFAHPPPRCYLTSSSAISSTVFIYIRVPYAMVIM